jgi:Methyltransferase domain
MTLGRTTQADLNWWLTRAAELDWTDATTYAETAPHSYVVQGRTTGMSTDDYVRAGRVIHTFGRPAKFYAMTGIYLTSPDGRLKWWTMDADVRDTGLINQATTERRYGVQNAPVTESGIPTPYDALAASYDERDPQSEVLATALREAFALLAGEHPPAVLDVGCGTGKVLDLALTKPDRYAGVDPSTPMLNHLVRKHPGVGAIYPMQIEDALSRRLFTAGQFEIVTILLEYSAELADDTITALEPIASRGLVLAVGDDVELRRSGTVSDLREPAEE